MKRYWLALSILAIGTTVLAAPSDSKTEGLLNKLLAPGPLIHGHKDLEHSDCLKCHTPREGIPDANCLACHKELKPQVENKTGYHGLTKQNCTECHSDHHGRDFDSTKVDPKSFNHKLTGYLLEGKHAELKCSECHIETRAKVKKTLRPKDMHFLGLKTSCLACHKEDDPHHFKGDWAKKDCNACHDSKAWDEGVRFDHGKDTKYKLIGKHAEVDCSQCHTPEGKPVIYQWKNLQKSQCLTCHEDQHKNHLSLKYQGGDCLKCHEKTQTTWKIEKFDHTLTGYTLKGKHATTQCVDCHKQTKAATKIGPKSYHWVGLKKDCLACHKDEHLFGSFKSKEFPAPNQCGACHNEMSWKKDINFDHNTQTRYKIAGKHLGLACIKCHTAAPKAQPAHRIYQWPLLREKTCEVCHATPHKTTFSKAMLAKACTECHVDAGWNIVPDKSGFDHSKTRFVLDGKHKSITCKDCHGTGKQQVFRFATPTKNFCIDCHKNVHLGQFSKALAEKACSECHSTSDFTHRKTFDHNQTRFKIDGKHDGLDCAKCHTATKEMMDTKPPKAKSRFVFNESAHRGFCDSCHQNVHINQFHTALTEKTCTTCHSTQDFTNRLPFNHGQTSFALRGKHADVKCEKCHIPTVAFFPAPIKRKKALFLFPEIQLKDCATCHKDPHQGSFGKKCSGCHREQNWKSTQNFHKNFTLSGVHYSLECSECHRGGKNLNGMSENCTLCHQKDDVHNGTLPNCGTCHTQHFWEVSHFRHSLTQFPLRGVHRTLDCYSCHSNGTYKGAPNQCSSCHYNDALAATSHTHTAAELSRNCNECHNQFAFK